MAKEKKTIHARIPRYEKQRNEWRKSILSYVERANKPKIQYTKDDLLELDVLFLFTKKKLSFHDVDNRLKDVMDALQGRVGGPKSKAEEGRIVPNDSQIYKVTVEKRESPKQSKYEGHLTIRKYIDTSK